MSGAEIRVLHDFRARFNEMREDVEAFDADFRATDFDSMAHEAVRDWCVRWWEDRLGSRLLELSERRLRGTQNRN